MNNEASGEVSKDLDALDFVSHILDSHGHNPCDMACPTIDDNAEELMALIAQATKEAYERGKRLELENILKVAKNNEDAFGKDASGMLTAYGSVCDVATMRLAEIDGEAR
jgi:hypothetical protein